MRHNENDFVIPALKALFYLGGRAMMNEIKDEIPKYIELYDGDLEMFESRKTRKEVRYRQVVGNIVSHKNDNFFKYVEKEKNGTQNYYFVLNQDGWDYVRTILEIASPSSEKILDEEGDLFAEDDLYLDVISKVSDIDQKIINYVDDKGDLDKRPASDQKLKEAVLDIAGRKCQYASYIGEEHPTFIRKDGKSFCIAHHLIPMNARKDFFPKNLDRASNLVCLCPTCHDRLHHGNLEEKAEMLKVLFDKYIEQLNDEGLFISFQTLLDEYYC